MTKKILWAGPRDATILQAPFINSLRDRGYEVVVIETDEDVEEKAKTSLFDLLVLHFCLVPVKYPNDHGSPLILVQKLRKRRINTPVIFLGLKEKTLPANSQEIDLWHEPKEFFNLVEKILSSS